MTPERPNKITVVVVAAEGDTATIEVNLHQHVRDFLRRALKELYGNPGPDPDGYDVVINGAIADVNVTIDEAGLETASEVAVLPKDVSRG